MVQFSKEEHNNFMKSIFDKTCKTLANTKTKRTPHEQLKHNMSYRFLLTSIILMREKNVEKDSPFLRYGSKKDDHINILNQLADNQKYSLSNTNRIELDKKCKKTNKLVKIIIGKDYTSNQQSSQGKPLKCLYEIMNMDETKSFKEKMQLYIMQFFPKKKKEFTQIHKFKSLNKLKKLLSQDHCICSKMNPFTVLFTNYADIKYCKSMFWLYFYNFLTTNFWAIIIVISNLILQKTIMNLFEKIYLTSKSQKSTIEIYTISIVLFFNTMVTHI